jgi:hypothetical protein
MRDKRTIELDREMELPEGSRVSLQMQPVAQDLLQGRTATEPESEDADTSFDEVQRWWRGKWKLKL